MPKGTTVEILDNGLDSALDALISNNKATHLLIASPFIKEAGVDAIVERINKRNSNAPKLRVAVITKFEWMDFITKSSDLNAIQRLYNLAKVECKNRVSRVEVLDLSPSLHAKLYLTNLQGITGSANLTDPGVHGGNAEICLNIFEPSILLELKKSFIHLADQASVVNESFLSNIEKQLLRLKAQQKEYEKQYGELLKAVNDLQNASKLCRLPIQKNAGLEDADYYGQMVAYLRWIRKGDGRKTKTALVNKIAETLNENRKNNNSKKDAQSSKRDAQLSVDFFKAIAVIRYPTKNKVCLTPFGEKVASAQKGQRKAVFEHIFRWSENAHHDRRLRNLMLPFENLEIDKYHTIESLLKRLKKGATIKGATINSTCIERNWLKSLGVIDLVSKKPTRYSRGAIFPKGANDLNAQLKIISKSEDSLGWLRNGV